MEEASGPPVEVWPDNWEAVQLFLGVSTQWRAGFGGAIGLDYGAIESAFRFKAIPRLRWGELFEDLQVMEAAALAVFHKKK